MSTYPNPWMLDHEPLESDHVQDYVGMVYLIVNKKNGRKYVGKKFFFSTRTLPPLKGKTRKRKKVVESDWKDYWGSSNELKEDIKKYGEDNFLRYVLRLCKSKTELSYYELKEQVDREALLTDEYYNDFIGGKINGKFLRNG